MKQRGRMQKRVRTCEGVDKRERWLERENRVDENQSVYKCKIRKCVQVYVRDEK